MRTGLFAGFDKRVLVVMGSKGATSYAKWRNAREMRKKYERDTEERCESMAKWRKIERGVWYNR